MSSALIISALGAFQASVSVLITLSYGFIAARLGMVRAGTARDVASLCRNAFLPALLITDIGSQLNHRNVLDYAPIFVWSIAYALTSIVIGKTAVKLFRLPAWTVTAVTFNNTTSLPLLLTTSLLETGIMDELAGNDVHGAVARARSYFLINSLVSKVLTFAIGPALFGEQVTTVHPPLEPDEETSLLSKSVPAYIDTIDVTTAKASRETPRTIRRLLQRTSTFFNPTTWGGVIAVTVGLVPCLHRAAFASSNEGGFLNAWLTSSLRNVGALFSGMEIFIVGSKLSDSFDVPHGEPSPEPPKRAVISIIVIRFFIWAAISIPLVYLLATRTRLLGSDPVLWWSMMLMPIGPPGLILSVLLEVVSAEQRSKMMVARVLAYSYMVTPLVSLAVVAALHATKTAQGIY